MSATKPIAPGHWVFWYSGLWKVLTVGDEHIPKEFTKGTRAVRTCGEQVATLEPINVQNHVLEWYLKGKVKYHGGVPISRLTRINPLSALKRGYLNREHR